jgi:hypothetical protein
MRDTGKRLIAGLQLQKSESGWYLLEYAVVVFGVAVFIVGFSDVARIFHARGAVRAGVTEGLRCLYPTDAGCSDQNLNTGFFPTERFNARITGDQSNKYELSQRSYHLTSSWFNEPVLEASFASKKLTSVTLTQPQDAYRQYQVLFPGTAHSVYLLKTRELPRVEPGDLSGAKEAILHPKFVDPETGKERRADLVVGGPKLEFNAGSIDPGVQGASGTVSFTIKAEDVLSGAAEWAGLKEQEVAYGFTAACYQGAKTKLSDGTTGIAWPSSGIPAKCSYRGDPTALYDRAGMRVPVIIHVQGTGYIRPKAVWPEWRGVAGQVVLKLYQGGKQIADLGGREFVRTNLSDSPRFDAQWGNFVARGAGYNTNDNVDVSISYRERCKVAGFSECSKYITLPLIAVGQPVELRFSLEWSRGSRAKDKPNVELGWEGEKVRIFYPSFSVSHEQRPCGYSASPNSCGASVAPMQIAFRTTDLDQSFSHKQLENLECGRTAPSAYQASIPDALETFRREVRQRSRKLAPISFWSNGLATDRCDALVSKAKCNETAREYMLGCEPEYSIPSEAESLCQLNDYQPKRDVISIPTFTYAQLGRVESRGGCTDQHFPECAKAELKNKGTVFLGAASNGCALALPVNVEPQSEGPLYKNTCVDELAGFIKRYREKNHIPDQAPVNSYVRNETPLIEDAPPDDSCREYRPIINEPGKSWLCADHASYVVANACCAKYGAHNCALERIADGVGGGQSGGYNQIIEGARQRTFTTVQTAYPAARMEAVCGQTSDGEPSSDNCIAIAAGPVDNGTSARMQASMRVPLALFDWFGLGNHTIVQYEETRVLESALVEGVG